MRTLITATDESLETGGDIVRSFLVQQVQLLIRRRSERLPLEWPSWIGSFKSIVHDQPFLNDSQRLAYLQNTLLLLSGFNSSSPYSKNIY